MKYYIMDEQYPLRVNRFFNLSELKQKINKVLNININRIVKTEKCTDTGAMENLIIHMEIEELNTILFKKNIVNFFNTVSWISYSEKYKCFSSILRINDELLDFLNLSATDNENH